MSTKPALVKRTHQIWTPTEVTKLQKLLSKRVSADEIGKQLNRSGKSIRRKAEMLGLSYATAYDHNKIAAAAKKAPARNGKPHSKAKAKISPKVKAKTKTGRR